MASSPSGIPLHEFKYSDFTDKKMLGVGEFGTVNFAKHSSFPKLAIREISRRYRARAEERVSLRQEAQKLMEIVSEHVIRLIGVVIEPEHLCLVLEFAEYGSLDKVLLRHEVPDALKIRIAYHVALGMKFLHEKNILHLRLKCHNILIAGDIQAKVSDVCFTRNREMNTWTRFAAVYSKSIGYAPSQPSGGSIAHVPPELIRNVNASSDKATDVYAYGIILWQVLTNKAPYEGETADDVCNRIVAGGRPDESLIRDDRLAELRSIMLKSWKDSKNERPSFEQICSELKSCFEKMEPLARDCARKCQQDLEDFSFPQSEEPVAPQGDRIDRRTQHDRQQRSNRSDGITSPMSACDERFRSRTAPERKDLSPSNSNEGFAERRVQQESKRGNEGTTLPVETSARSTSHEDFYQVAEELGNRWREFGRFLQFSDGQLDNIAMNFEKEGYPEIPYQMLRQWKNREGYITIAYLASKLKSNGKFYIARKLNP